MIYESGYFAHSNQSDFRAVIEWDQSTCYKLFESTIVLKQLSMLCTQAFSVDIINNVVHMWQTASSSAEHKL